MNVLYGLLQPDEGEILVNDARCTSRARTRSRWHRMVHQHFMLVPVFTVTDNIMLGAEQVRVASPAPGPPAARKRSSTSRPVRLAVDPDAVIEDLPVGVQQRVEIVKALTARSTCSSSTTDGRADPQETRN